MNTSKKSLFLIAVGVLVLGLLGWTVSKQFRSETGQDQGPAEQPLATVDSAGNAMGQGAPAAAPAVRTVSPGDPRSVFAKSVDPAQQQKENDRVLAEFERQHRSQPVDATWKGKAETALEEITVDSGIQKSGIQPTSYKSDCRSETCEISASFKSAGDADDWGMMYITMSGQTFAQTKSMVIPKPDGTSELRIYGYRKR